jgi:hypothetical protein
LLPVTGFAVKSPPKSNRIKPNQTFGPHGAPASRHGSLVNQLAAS